MKSRWVRVWSHISKVSDTAGSSHTVVFLAVSVKFYPPSIFSGYTETNQLPYLHWEKTGVQQQLAETISSIMEDRDDSYGYERGMSGRPLFWPAELERDLRTRWTDKNERNWRRRQTWREGYNRNKPNHAIWEDVMSNPLLRERLATLESSWWNGSWVAKLQNNRFADYFKSSRHKTPNRRFGNYGREINDSDERLERRRFELGTISQQEEQLLSMYVQKDPPLHIRRTLDQYYYSWLENTTRRDRDQVISRNDATERNARRLKHRMAVFALRDAVRIGEEIKERGGLPDERPKRWQRIRSDKLISNSDLKLMEECVTGLTEQRVQAAQSPVLVVDQLWIWQFEGDVLP
jgi:hypothetical protein